jgi:LPS sulfotransferase NodH
VYLHRLDVVGQAVSWCRAEQTGFWQHGDTAVGAPRFDLARLHDFVVTIGEHNAEWRGWFERQNVRPLVITYEELVRRPRSTVERVASLLGVRIPDGWQPIVPHGKQGDAVNAHWAARLRASLGD